MGRTGTFIAIDNVLEQVEKEGVVGIPGTVSKLRQQRPAMVKNVVSTHVCVCMCMHVCVGACMRVWVCTCMHGVCMHECMWVCTCMHACLCM